MAEDWKTDLAYWMQCRTREQWVCFNRGLVFSAVGAAANSDFARYLSERAVYEAGVSKAALPQAVPECELHQQAGKLDGLLLEDATVLDAVEPSRLLREGGRCYSVSTQALLYARPYDYDFAHAAAEWSAPPWTGIGHFSTAEQLQLSDAQIRESVERVEKYRYTGFDNDNDSWRRGLRLDSTAGKTVLDFGCGMGVEALQYARGGNLVWAADIAPANTAYVERVFQIFGYADRFLGRVAVTGTWPFFTCDTPLDVFHSAGVLHHTPQIGNILRRVRELLAPDGRCHISLYSEHTWPGTKDIYADVTTQPGFFGYVRGRDPVGRHADWYSVDKLAYVLQRNKTGLEIESHSYAGSNCYLCAILRKVE